MITADEAAAFAGTSLRAVYSAVESGHVHFIETADGFLRVCMESLAAQSINSTPSIEHSIKH
jgi:hypothetical protein